MDFLLKGLSQKPIIARESGFGHSWAMYAERSADMYNSLSPRKNAGSLEDPFLFKAYYVVVSNLYFHPYLGKWSNLTNIFQMGWNHQPAYFFRGNKPQWLRFRDGFSQRNQLPNCPKTTPCRPCQTGGVVLSQGYLHIFFRSEQVRFGRGDVSGTMRRVKLEHAVSWG